MKVCWSRGLCWKCEKEDEEVLPIGSIRTQWGDLDMFACGACVYRLELTAWNQHREKDYADLSAR